MALRRGNHALVLDCKYKKKVMVNCSINLDLDVSKIISQLAICHQTLFRGHVYQLCFFFTVLVQRRWLWLGTL